jgi:hypothetical protein
LTRNTAAAPLMVLACGATLNTRWSDKKHCSDERISFGSHAALPLCEFVGPHSTWYCIVSSRFALYAESGFTIRREPFTTRGDLGELGVIAVRVPLSNELTACGQETHAARRW